jgi:formate-dependent nitrite reductase membrane component NrfD
METVLQTNWGWEIAVYLFLGGLSAGILCVVAIINLVTKDRFKDTIRFCSWAGVVLLAIGVFLLLLDVGLPMRAIMLWQSFVNLGSWMAFGAWFLFIGIIIYGIYALSNTNWVTNKLNFLLKCRTALAVIIIPLSLGIAIYTGLLLGVLDTHPLWNTWLLPVLFTVSALDTGVAFVIGYAVLGESGIKDRVARLKKILEVSTVALILLECVILTIYMSTVASAGGVAAASVGILTSGTLSQLFWVLLIACGLAVPLLISALLLIRRDIAEKTWEFLPLLGVSLCLVGGFTLRYIILMAGLPVYA